jgi:hypothetical protein
MFMFPRTVDPRMCDLPEEEFAEYLAWREAAEAKLTTSPRRPWRESAVSIPTAEAPAPIEA